MFKVNKKDLGALIVKALVPYLLTMDRDLTPCSNAVIFDFEHVNVDFDKF